jgi:hypothetical protein
MQYKFGLKSNIMLSVKKKTLFYEKVVPPLPLHDSFLQYITLCLYSLSNFLSNWLRYNFLLLMT